MIDCIIVGQGIAGTCLAWSLLQRRKKIVVIDDGQPHAASRVGTGMFHPLVFKTLDLGWKVNTILPFAGNFYRGLEETLGGQFFYPLALHKVFTSDNERQQWERLMGEEDHEDLLKAITDKDDLPGIKTPHGTGEVGNAGRLDLAGITGSFNQYLAEKEMLLAEAFDYSLLESDNGTVGYKDITAKQLIFCEGHGAQGNPFFNWLPFVPAKGELLTIKADDLKLGAIVNGKVVLVPLGSGLYRVGSTYEWNDLSTEPTEEARADLLARLEETITVPYEVVDHFAGIRPTVRDRRPFIGQHPQHGSLYIFNGLGTKGVALAPFFADQLADHLMEDKSLDDEVNIERYSRYFSAVAASE